MEGYLIQSALEWYAIKTPEHPALSFQGQSMSYAELDSRSNRLANAMLAQGIKPKDRVGIYHQKSLELGVAIYATLKCGCIFVPLDPFSPVARLELILRDCGISHLITSDQLSNRVSELNHAEALHIYGVSSKLNFPSLSWPEIQRYPENRPDPKIIDQDLAYIMYTSGSTGLPKGMMHTHVGSNSYARWGADHVRLTADDRVASHAPLHFDLSIFDFFSTAQAGATVSLVPEAVTKFPASWTQTIEDERISVVFTVPYTLITMLEQGALDQRDLSSMRWIMFGGEPMPPGQLRRLMDKMDAVQFTNVYGPAEAPSCACYDIPSDLTGNDDEPLPIGIVSRNSEDLIVNHNDEPCAVGEPGELCIRSTTLTRGYWNRPDLNADAFLYRDGHGPFPIVFYRTGDRVIRREDGLMVFLGRMDRMVKTRGNRVELDEVEAALISHSGVFEAAAYVVPDEFGSNIILAAVAPHGDNALAEATLLTHLKKKLPFYAVPREITLHNSLPHTSTGKIDRRSLTEAWLQNQSNEIN